MKMLTKPILLVCSIAIWCPPVGQVAFAETFANSESDSKAVQVSATGSLVPIGNILKGVFDLGDLSAGRKVAATLKVLDTTAEELSVERIETSCGCEKAVLVGKALAPGKESTIELAIDVPVKRKSPTFTSEIRLAVRNKNRGYKDSLAYVSLYGDDEVKHFVPVNCTLKDPDLSLSTSPEIAGVDAIKVDRDDVFGINFVLEPSLVPRTRNAFHG